MSAIASATSKPFASREQRTGRVCHRPPRWAESRCEPRAGNGYCRVRARALELQANGRHLLLSGDPVAAGEVLAAPSADGLDGIAVCLLDVSPQAQTERLVHRGDDTRLLPDHRAFAQWMRGHAGDPRHMPQVLTTGGWEAMRWDRLSTVDPQAGTWGTQIVDTSTLSRDQVAAQVLASTPPVRLRGIVNRRDLRCLFVTVVVFSAFGRSLQWLLPVVARHDSVSSRLLGQLLATMAAGGFIALGVYGSVVAAVGIWRLVSNSPLRGVRPPT